MQTGVLSGLQLTSMFPNLVVDNFYRKTQNSIDAGKKEAPYGYVIPAGTKDMTRAATLVNILRDAAHRDRHRERGSQGRRPDVPGRLLRHQARPAVRPSRQEPAREAELSRSQSHHLRRQRLDDGAGDGRRREGDQGQGDPRRRGDAGRVRRSSRAGRPGRGTAGLAVAHYGSNNMIAFRYKLKSVAMKIADKSFTRRRRGLPGRVVRHRRRRRHERGEGGGRAVRPDGRVAVRDADRGDARRRPAARRDLLVVGQHAGDRLVPARLRSVRHPVRSDLQGAR